MGRKWRAAVLAAVVLALLAGASCSPSPSGGVVMLRSAEDGKGVFIGEFGAAVPTEAVIDLRVVGALVGMTWCVNVRVFDRPPTWFPSLDAIGSVKACSFVPIVVGDATITVGPFASGWEDAVGGSLDGLWFFADVSVEVPPGSTLTAAGIRGVRLADATAVPACLVNPGVIVVC